MDPASPLWGTYLIANKTHVHIKTCLWTLTVASFSSAEENQSWKQCDARQLVNGWTHWWPHALEYYSAINRPIRCHTAARLRSDARGWVDEPRLRGLHNVWFHLYDSGGQKRRWWPQANGGGRCWPQGAPRELSGWQSLREISVMTVTQLHAFVKTHRTLHYKGWISLMSIVPETIIYMISI